MKFKKDKTYRKATPKIGRMRKQLALANARLSESIHKPRYYLDDYDYEQPASMTNPVPSNFGIEKCCVCGEPHSKGTVLIKCGEEGYASLQCLHKYRIFKAKTNREPCPEEIRDFVGLR